MLAQTEGVLFQSLSTVITVRCFVPSPHILWAASGNPVVCRWQSDGPQVAIRWAAGGNPMGRSWQSCGLPVTVQWAAGDNPMGRRWQSCGPPVELCLLSVLFLIFHAVLFSYNNKQICIAPVTG